MQWNQIKVDVSVKIPVEEIAALKPEQAKALMAGIAAVLSATKASEKGDAK